MKTHPNSTTITTATTTTTTNPSTPTRPRSTASTTKGRPRSRSTSPCCPHCGNSLPLLSVSDPHTALLEAQKQIADLEAQVHLLNKKATAAVDRWADYEDELSRLRAASMSSTTPTTTTTSSLATAAGRPLSSGPPSMNGLGIMMNPGSTTNRNSRPSTAVTEAPSSRGSGFFGGGVASGAASRISQLLSPRKSTPNLAANNHNSHNTNSQQAAAAAAAAVTRTSFLSSATANSSSLHPHPQPLPSPTPSADDLMEALMREQSLRQAAEGRLSETSREVEELSVTLFEQANEMVASERRARAQLEERVGVLERREDEKRGRLERLEGSVARIERISRILGEEGEG
ncbi:ribosomal protein L32 [Apiospora phragmitis]|uniref:Ribosomal protein L32 n=1 Tax=Apiospora phragmitis TaxID=2905665 RepID=A0ABR1UIJ6_9PEZI